MPRRKDPLITGQFYHIYNRSIDNRKVFDDESMAAHFLFALRYYRSNSIDRSLSKYKILDPSLQQVLLSQINDPTTFRIDILAYCLMPNHMHLLAKQRKDDGITITLSNVLNSFTRHYNSLHSRKGPIFLPRFRAKHIQSPELLMHVSRYIHLNPFSGNLVDSIEDIEKYKSSSFKEYLSNEKNKLVTTAYIRSHFRTITRYKEYVLDYADYQKSLEEFKYVKQ